jgi:hypothetical protein
VGNSFNFLEWGESFRRLQVVLSVIRLVRSPRSSQLLHENSNLFSTEWAHSYKNKVLQSAPSKSVTNILFSTEDPQILTYLPSDVDLISLGRRYQQSMNTEEASGNPTHTQASVPPLSPTRFSPSGIQKFLDLNRTHNKTTKPPKCKIELYIQGIHKRMMRFQKWIKNLCLTLHGHNIHRQRRQLSSFLMRYQQFASHAYCVAAGPVSKIVFFHCARSDVLLQMETRTFSLGHPVRQILHRAISFFGGVR